jgi:hypothetical protein
MFTEALLAALYYKRLHIAIAISVENPYMKKNKNKNIQGLIIKALVFRKST